MFNHWNDKRKVNVNRNDNDWNDNWWFAGVRNSLHFSSGNFPEEFCFSTRLETGFSIVFGTLMLGRA